jgi:UDP-GlcNAc:undecaprenyl-phosphate GlcNAc-1-phosphate transferase
MKAYVFAFLGSAFLAVILTPIVSRLARRMGAVDRPNVRSVHQQPTPRIGGVAIFLSAMTVIISFLLLSDKIDERLRDVQREMVVLLCSATFIFVIGLIDDLRGLRARSKLLAEVFAAGALCIVGVKIESIGVVEGLELRLGWLAWPATIFWVVGITNAVNLSDGLDGLAAGISAIACGVIAVFSLYGSAIHTGSSQSSDMMMALVALVLLGSLYGFLIFNFNPAKVFMGDCGSLFLGFTIAAGSVMCVSKSAALAGVALPILALGIPIFDTLFSMLRRFLDRRSLFAPDRSHFHHRLLALGLKHRQAVLAIYVATLITAGLGLLMIVCKDIFSVVIFVCLLMFILLLFRIVGAVRLTDTMARLWQKHAASELQRQERETFESLELKFRQLPDPGQAWEAICEAALRMGFAWISLKISHEDGRVEEKLWRCPETGAELSRVVTMRLPLDDGHANVSRRLEIAIYVNGSLESANRRATFFGRLIDESRIAAMFDPESSGGMGPATPIL